MPNTIVVVGGSAGSVAPLISLLAALPRDCRAIVFVTLHLPPQVRSVWPEILSRATGLRVIHPYDGQRFSNETVWVAPPNRHLLVGNDCVTLGTGPPEHHYRPAVDAMFRSAAVSHRERVIGVVLSGRYHDGASGLAAISARGGTTVVQCPFDALERSMPESALVGVEVNHCVAAREIGALLGRLVRTPSPVTTYESPGQEPDDANLFNPDRSGSARATTTVPQSALRLLCSGHGSAASIFGRYIVAKVRATLQAASAYFQR